jgi:PPOX class probable F420-dependent enzyme
MAMIDLTSKLGLRAAQRLQEDHIIWLTTVASDGTPQPNPVWFHWDGKTISVRSQPDSYKLRNISRNPKVSVNFQVNEEGGDVIVLTGDATIDRSPPKPDPRFIEKYREAIPKIGHTPESLAASYSVLIRISPRKMRGF